MKKIVNLDGTEDLRYYWQDLQSEAYRLSKRVQGGVSLVIWADFNPKEKTSLIFTETKMSSFDYQGILGNNFVTLNPLILAPVNITDWGVVRYFSCPSYFRAGVLIAVKTSETRKIELAFPCEAFEYCRSDLGFGADCNA